MTPSSHRVRGYMYIAASALCWGISATLGRAAFTGRLAFFSSNLRPLDPLIISQSRTTLSLLLLVPILLTRRSAASLRMPGGDLIRCLTIGVLGVAASNYFYYLAIQRTNVAVAIVLQYTAPVWVLLYMVARKLQRPTLLRISSVGLAVIGCALVIQLIGPGRWNVDMLGVGAAILASFSFAFYNIGGHSVLAIHDRWKVLVWVLTGASAFWISFWLFFWLLSDPRWNIAGRYSAAEWIFMLVFALVSVMGPFSCYFAGLEYLEPTSAVVVSCLEPVFSIVLAAMFLRETVGPLQVAGIVVVLAATVLVQLPERGRREELAILEPIE